MKNRWVYLILVLVLSLESWCLVAGPVGAAGLGVAPAVLTIKDAIPGQEYTEEIFVYNTSSTDYSYPIEGSGDIKSWVTFYTFEDQSKAITEIPVPANTHANAAVKISIPADASPLVYKGQLVVTGAPSSDTGPGAHVRIQLPIDVIIQMVGAPDVIPETTTTPPAFVPTLVSGELNLWALTCEGQPAVGQVTKFDAVLKNLTGAATTGYLSAEVYLGDKLIDTFKSDALLVPGGGDTTMPAYYKFQKAGDYTINATVIYEGKVTQKKTFTLKVSGPAGGSASSMPLVAIIGIVVGVLVVIGVVLFFINRSRKKIKVRSD